MLVSSHLTVTINLLCVYACVHVQSFLPATLLSSREQQRCELYGSFKQYGRAISHNRKIHKDKGKVLHFMYHYFLFIFNLVALLLFLLLSP